MGIPADQRGQWIIAADSIGEQAVKKIHIKTELPGPKARELLARDALVVSPSYPRDYPFVMSHGKGAEVWDVDGNRFLDFAAGIAVCSTGHSHPRRGAGDQGCGGALPAHLLGLLARRSGAARRAHATSSRR